MDHRGGRLVYLTRRGECVRPARFSGMATVHNNRIVHGVSRLESGTRYGLFLLVEPRCGSMVS